jgi:hypothetical protein
MKIINKPTFRFSKDSNLKESLTFCKDFAIINKCVVLISFLDHTKPIDSNTDLEKMEKEFFNKTFNKHIFNH